VRITVEHPSTDELSQETWAFYVSDSWHGHDGIAVVLDSYTFSKRLTVRDKFRAHSEWSRWGTTGFGGVTKLANPAHVPPWVRDRVVRMITESITFLQPSDTTTHNVMSPESRDHR
jgi:hypothetical protein